MSKKNTVNKAFDDLVLFSKIELNPEAMVMAKTILGYMYDAGLLDMCGEFQPYKDFNPRLFGDLIREHREQKGISQRELSIKSGVCTNTIARWECGYVKAPTIPMITSICNILEIDVNDLLFTF